MNYGCVLHRARSVAVVGSGPSLRDVDLMPLARSNACIIAVNAAVRHLPRADLFFTCDPSKCNRKLMVHQRRGVYYYAAAPTDYGTPGARAGAHRASPERNVTFLRRLEGSGPWKHKPGLSEEANAVHTGNSAYGALGLAYHMYPEKIALFGVDALDEAGYAFGLFGRPADLSHLPEMFRTTVPQLRARAVSVVCGSKVSKVDCYHRMSPQEAMSWLA